MGMRNLLKYEGIAGACTVLCDAEMRPVQIWFEPFSETSCSLMPGETTSAIVRKDVPHQGGTFLEGETGQQLFLGHKRDLDLVEGQRCKVSCVASARNGKLARVRLIKKDDWARVSAYDAWLTGLVEDSHVDTIDTTDAHRRIDEVLEDLSSMISVLPGGGRLTITPTPALVAVDVDTAGRRDRGDHHQRAHRINLDAVQQIARDIALRDLGGTFVLDCLAPISKANGLRLRDSFVSTFRTVSRRKVDALPPSKLGLMEIAIAWGAQPLHERLLETPATHSAAFALWRALRNLEKEAIARSADQLSLQLPKPLFALFQVRQHDYMQRIESRFGARIEVVPSEKTNADVRSR